MASAVSVSALGLYQSLSGPLDLRPMDIVVTDSPKSLAGTDEFYPELNQPPAVKKVTRGTFDLPETLLLFLFLTLPAALVLARAGRNTKRRPWILGVPPRSSLPESSLRLWPGRSATIRPTGPPRFALIEQLPISRRGTWELLTRRRSIHRNNGNMVRHGRDESAYWALYLFGVAIVSPFESLAHECPGTTGVHNYSSPLGVSSRRCCWACSRIHLGVQ